MATKAKSDAAEEAFQFRRRVNTGLLERLKAKLEELRAEPEEGEALEDLEDELFVREEDE